MSTEKIQLPDFVIANLYTDLLVVGNDVISKRNISKPTTDLAAKPTTKQPAGNEKEWYLGNNGKKITIIIKEADVAFINDQHLQFLSNILSACKLNLGDIALVNHLNNALVYADLKQKLQPKFIIAFDLQTKEIQLPFTIPNYQVQLHDNCKFLFASSLKTMEGDSQEAKLEKSKLWASLKNMFQL
ncbi:MAG: hypothetical protein WCH78_04080 [Bacteroidota bacterium]